MTFVSDLEPTVLWGHFDRIMEIPRASKDEDRVRQYVIDLAEERGFDHHSDAIGNLVVRVPATDGREGAAITVLQSHLDMVQEKTLDSDHDFAHDPIRPVAAGEYLKADRTTLGADNGIGVATMLALITSDEVPHGPLELLFTLDEETGLTGAAQLGTDLLTGRRLINLDTELEGALCIGCAGGAGNRLTLPLEKTAPEPGSQALDVELRGLKGGHSGVDIHLQRGNAIKLLGRALGAATVPFQLAAFAGGASHNAIPRQAKATVLVASEDRQIFVDQVSEAAWQIANELLPGDSGCRLEVEPTETPKSAWSAASTATALGLIQALPTGVMAMSFDLPDLVETSSTLATAHEKEDGFELLISTRSSVASASAAQVQRIGALASLAGAANYVRDGYPGWKPNPDSPLLNTFREIYTRAYGKEPLVGAVHAGLETGIIGEKYPGMDMVSCGPTIEFPHSPDERVHIASVGRFWDVLVTALDELS